MAQKPEIQYVDQFYVYGSEAKKLAIRQQTVKSRAAEFQPHKDQVRTICIDPVALVGLVVAVVMVVALAMGAMQIKATWETYDAVSAYLLEVKMENTNLEHDYRTSYDLAEVEATALAIGMIPATEAKTIVVDVTVPEPQPEPTFWDDVRWFVKGLFA